MKKFNKKAIFSALAITVGTAASVHAVEGALKDPLFSLKEIGSQQVLIAHDGEAKCGEGKCGEGKCGLKKLKKIFKKKKKAGEAKCGEGKCGEGKCGGSK